MPSQKLGIFMFQCSQTKMSNIEHKKQLAFVLAKLGISNATVAAQVEQFLLYCNHDRLVETVGWLGSERSKASRRKPNQRNSFQKKILDQSKIWEIAKEKYNQHLRDYSFLYIAFNLLEDTLRRAIDLHYFSFYGEDWFKNKIYYPQSFSTSPSAHKQKELNKLLGCSSGHKFCSELTFGVICEFVHDQKAWSVHNIEKFFEGKIDPENPKQLLPNLNICDVYERLEILRWRRNSIYHHNVMRKFYTIPSKYGCAFSQKGDGKFSNTRDRIYELLKYFGLKPKLVFSRVIGNSEQLLRNSSISSS